MSETLAEARLHFPIWVVCAYAVIHLALAVFVPYVLTWFGIKLALLGYRHDPELTWAEQARRTFPARQVGMLFPILCMIGIEALTLTYGWPFSEFERIVIGFVAGIVAYLSGQAATRTLERMRPAGPISTTSSWKSLGIWLLAYQGATLVLFQFVLVPIQISIGAVAWVAVLVIAFLWLVTGRGIYTLVWLGLAKPPDERLMRIIERASSECGHVPKATYVIDCEICNALAYPNLDIIVFTRRITEVLNDEELFAVATHELGHLTEPPQVIRVRILHRLLILPFLFIHGIFAWWGLTGIMILVFGVILVSILAKRLSLKMEVRADSISKEHEEQEGVYALALEKLYRDNGVPAVMSHKHTHPHLYDRMVAAGVEPDYPRPDPPPRFRFALILFSIMIPMTFATVLGWASLALNPTESTSEARFQWAVGLSYGPDPDARLTNWLGYKASQRGDQEAALAFMRAAVELNERSSVTAADLARVLAEAGKCDEAVEALTLAERRWEAYENTGHESIRIRVAREAVARCQKR